jgi:hypothetical protein
VPTRDDYRWWVRQLVRRDEYPPNLSLIDLLFDDWRLALDDAGLLPDQPEE